MATVRGHAGGCALDQEIKPMDKTLFHYMIFLQLGSHLCALGLTSRKTKRINFNQTSCDVTTTRCHASAGGWFEKNNDMRLDHALNARTPSGWMSMKRINATPTTLGIQRMPNSHRLAAARFVALNIAIPAAAPAPWLPPFLPPSLDPSYSLSLSSSALVSVPLPLQRSPSDPEAW
jgi:hypothetical protein